MTAAIFKKSTHHVALMLASIHLRRTVNFRDCRRKAVEAAEIGDRVVVVESAAVAVGIAVGNDVLEAAVCRRQGRKWGRTGCEPAIAVAEYDEVVLRQAWHSHRAPAGTSAGQDRR